MERTPPTVSRKKLFQFAFQKGFDRAEFCLQIGREKGPVVRLPVPGRNIYIVTGADEVRRVLVQNSTNYKKSPDYQILSDLLGQGLLTSEGDVWLHDRRLQHPLFHGRALEQFISQIEGCAGQAVDRLSSLANEPVRFDLEMARYALHVIGLRILSLDVREFVEAITYHLDICQAQIVHRGWAIVDWARWFRTPGAIRFWKSFREIEKIVQELLRRRQILGDRDEFGKERIDLVSALQGSSKSRIQDQIITLFLAGHETSAVGMAWLGHYLALNTDLQSEIRMKPALLNAVIDEGLRLYPPVGFLGRQSLQSDVLAGYTIPRESILVLSPYATHRLDAYWSDPGVFNYERFLGDQKNKIPVGAFFPFALGPRGCVGIHLAYSEMRIFWSQMLKRFRWTSLNSEPIRAIPLVSMRPSDSILIRCQSI